MVEHFERIRVHDIEEILDAASRSLDGLARRVRGAADAAEQARLNREIGLGRMVFAFDHQDAAEAAESISDDQIAWADDPDEERRLQAELLRQLAPGPFQRNAPEEDA